MVPRICVAALGVLIGGRALWAQGPPARAQAPNARPNVLIVVTDDQNYEQMRVMNKTRRWLGRGGVRYTHAYATTPQCCPSRASILTGRYAHNHGVQSNLEAADVDPRSELQRYLQAARYRTALFGKYFNSWSIGLVPPFFNRWAFTNSSFAYRGGKWNIQGKVTRLDTYDTTFISNRAVGFLRSSEKHDLRPWFIYLAPTAPHAPFTPESRYSNHMVPLLKPDPAELETDLSDKPPFVQDQPPRDIEDYKQIFVEQQRTLKSVDDMMGRLHLTLQELGEQNTLVFFISDNGFLLRDHGMRGKAMPYVRATHVPMYAWWPLHLPAGIADDRLAANIDIAPTVIQAAGIAPSPGFPIDGRSLLNPGDRRDHLLMEFWNSAHGQARLVPSWASTFTPAYQYTEYYGTTPGDDAISFREYYDLTNDPYQLTNLLADGDPGNDPAVIGRLHDRLAADRTCLGRSCP